MDLLEFWLPSTQEVCWRHAKENRILADKCMRKGCFDQVSLATCLVPLGPEERGILIQIAEYFYWNRSGFLELANFFCYHSQVKIYIALNCWGGKRRNFPSGNQLQWEISPWKHFLLVHLNFSFLQYNRYSIWDYWPIRTNFRHTEELSISFSTDFPLSFRQYHLDHHICMAGIFFFLSFTAKVVRWLNSYRGNTRKKNLWPLVTWAES